MRNGNHIGSHFLVLSDNDTAAGLVRSEDKYLGYLHVLGRISCIDCYIGYVVACERLYALIYVGCPCLVATEADIAEVGLYKSWLQVCHAYGCVGDVDA